jgi:hypothetical protein
MATREGYVNGASWFRTHPPFYDRMVHSKKEMMYLPDRDGLTTNSPRFDRMKEELVKIVSEVEEEKKERPSLRAPEEGCPPPDTIEYIPGEPIESVCELPRKVPKTPGP